jgi:serine/threonine protein kinase
VNIRADAGDHVMTIAVAHPPDEVLQSFGMGKLDDVSSESVSQHLEGCDPCQRRVAELSSDDFLGRLQKAGVVPDNVASGWSPSAASSTEEVPSVYVPCPSADTLPPELADHPDWEIIRELGRGGMGVVYLAENRLMGRQEVLKVVGTHLLERPGVLDRFLREIQSAARLQHPNIVTAYSAMRLGPSLVLSMEYVKGFDLAKIVKGKGPLSVAQACHFTHQAALGLQHAHERNTVHRDIKPANLMVSEGKKGVVKVLDFGLAKVTSESQADSNLTREGQMVGTPAFIAPEQIRDAKSADIRADIYSLGCTLYYLLTGGPPFRGKNLWDIYQAHFSMDAVLLNVARPEVPVELSAVVAKMMAKDPRRRFQTPGEVARALTPFFKPATAQPAALSAGVHRVDTLCTPTPPASGNAAPTSPVTLSAAPTSFGLKPPEIGENGVAWNNLTEIKETERSFVRPAAAGPVRRPSWLWPSVVIGLLIFGLFTLWLGGVFKVNTPDGVIVVENVPRDADVVVDGNKITFTWPVAAKPLEIRAVPGRHKVQVQKEGVTLLGEEVEIAAGGRQSIKVRLEPLPVAAAGPADSSAAADRVSEAKPAEKKADYDAIATGKWVSALKGETVLQDERLFLPDQKKARDVIIRAKVKKITGQNLGFGLRTDENLPPNQGYGAWFNGGNWFGIYKWGDGPNDLAQWHGSTDFDDDFELAFSAVGETLTVYADGKRIGAVRDPDYRMGSLSINAKSGRSLFQDVEIMILDASVPSNAGAGFVELFNRVDLTGWNDVLANGSEWKVVDGVLEGHGAGEEGPAVLVSERTNLVNFRLRLKYRYREDGGGNLEIRRSPAGENRSGYLIHHGVWPTLDQWQVPVGSVTKLANHSYRDGFPWEKKADIVIAPLNEWNTLEVTAVRSRITSVVNGKLVCDYNDPVGWFGSGAIAVIARGDSIVQFQQIIIEELPD